MLVRSAGVLDVLQAILINPPAASMSEALEDKSTLPASLFIDDASRVHPDVRRLLVEEFVKPAESNAAVSCMRLESKSSVLAVAAPDASDPARPLHAAKSARGNTTLAFILTSVRSVEELRVRECR
jgi:hypothetical protein